MLGRVVGKWPQPVAPKLTLIVPAPSVNVPSSAPVLPDTSQGRPPAHEGGGSLGAALDVSLTVVDDQAYARDEWIHASRLHEMCSRQAVLARASLGTPRVIRSADRMRWDIGHAVQAWVENKYLGPMGRLWGDWRCEACDELYVGVLWRPACACGKPLHYVEREVRHAELGIVGHVDGYDFDVARADEIGGVLEIKTISERLFGFLREPKSEHVWRTMLYCWLDDRSWGRILYVSMGYESRSPFREFLLERVAISGVMVWRLVDSASGRLIREIPDDIEATVRATVAAVRTGGTRACGASSDARAMGCAWRTQCWQEW